VIEEGPVRPCPARGITLSAAPGETIPGMQEQKDEKTATVFRICALFRLVVVA
jgi:hypothetical protein